MASPAEHPDARGRKADEPSQIDRPGWRDILLRTKNEIADDHVSMIAAGVAYYAMLAIFPAVAALISIWGLVADPQQITRQIDRVSSVMPPQAASLIQTQAGELASHAGGGVTFAAIGGIILALYSANNGTKSLIEGLNIIYDEREKRGFFKLNLVALGLTMLLVVGMILAMALVILLPALLGHLGLGAVLATVATYLRWPLLFVGAMVVLTMFYRYAPSREEPRWRWVSWGAAAATLLWTIGSIGFSIYVRNFGNYNATYGSLGAVIILLFWLWLSAFIVLLGAELNSEMEHQTGLDTTAGEPQPRGERGAYVADTLGEEP
jgi:membrane protein